MKLTIASKILLGFGVALFFVAGIGMASYRSLTHLIETSRWVSHTHVVLERLGEIGLVTRDAVMSTRGYIITGDPQTLARYQQAKTSLREIAREVRRLTADNLDRQKKLDILEPLVVDEFSALQSAIEKRRQKQFEVGSEAELTERSATLINSVLKLIVEMQADERALLEQREKEAQISAHTTLNIVLYGALLSLGITGFIGFALQRSIIRPLQEFKQFVAVVGSGDLTRKSEIASRDEVGQLANSLNHMVDGLKDVTEQARNASLSLNSAVGQILTSTRQQATSTAEQAAAVVQANATMQEISQSGFQISDRAKQVAAMAEDASKASHAGLDAVQITNTTMEAIREQAEAVAEHVVSLSTKTQTVGEIVASVNDIAEQSHLLALNAAIQAAAAGEHGRTFAVVASEIKNLADQSRDATVQVRSILGDIQKAINTSVMLTEEAVKRVDSGKQQAEVAADTIRDMNESIQQSMQAFQQIVAGTNQQQIGLQQVGQAFKDISQASTQTAASTRQMESAATSLITLGEQLARAMDRYRV